MWWKLRQAKGNHDFQAFAREIQENASRSLILFTALTAGVWIVTYTLIRSGDIDLRIILLFLFFILLTIGSLRLVNWRLFIAQVAWILSCLLFLSMALLILKSNEFVFLFTIIPLMAALLIGWPAAIAALILVPAVLLGLVVGFQVQAIPNQFLWLTLVGGILLSGMATAIISPLASAVEWAIGHYESANHNLEEARGQRVELKQIQEDLVLANKELSRLSAQLRVLTEKAEEARRAKEDFVASVSHELRTPLNMIIGYTDLIIKSPRAYGKALPSRLLADIASIQCNSEHLVDLINDVLDLSQIDAGRMALNRGWVSIQQIVEAAIIAIQPLFLSKQLYLKQEFQASEVFAYCDATRIREVVLNLLSNAGRYTDHGGVTLSVVSSETQVTVKVSDTGRGIAPADLERIFEPFQQLDPLLHHQTGASGLGLTISKRFIEMHGGKMWLESKPGQGATFYFSIPLNGAVEDAPPTPHAARWINPYYEYAQRDRPFKAAASRPSPRFVVVEKEHSIQRLFQRYLGDIEVAAFDSLESARQDMSQSAAQALIINQPLAQEAGRDADNLLDEALPQPVPVISCWIPGREEAARGLGVMHFLIKPVQRELLLERLDELGKKDLNILLVDDDREMLHLFARIISFARPDYSVLRAESGQEALHLMRQRQPDVVLLDLLMPGMDGFEVLRQKRNDSRIAPIPVIIVSSNDPAGLPVISKEFHVRLPKGFSVREFLDCVLAIQSVFNTVPPPPRLTRPETSPALPASTPASVHPTRVPGPPETGSLE